MTSFYHSLCLILLTLHICNALNLISDNSISRRDAIRTAFQGVVSTSVASVALTIPSQRAWAQEGSISDEEIKKIVTKDIIEKQFLVTGNLSPEIYRETALFTDEIDTYKKDQWMTGTQKLFVGERSEVRLVGDVQVTPEKVEFRFDEDLCFRIPFRPTVHLTGSVILMRDEAGFITSYKENWDQSTIDVLKTAKF